MEKRRGRRKRAVTRHAEEVVVSGLEPIRTKRYQRFARQVLSDHSGRKAASTAKE